MNGAQRFYLTAFAAMMFGSSHLAGAAVLTHFDFTGDDGTEATATPADPTVGVVGGALTRGPGFSVSGNAFTANSFGVSPYIGQFNDTDNYHSTVAADDALGHYVTFALTPSDPISLSDIVFNVGFQSGPGTGTDTPGLQYSTDGTDFTPVTSVTYSGGDGSTGDPNSAGGTGAAVGTFDLSSIPTLQDDTATVTFRLYALSTSGNPYQDAGFGYSSTTAGLGGITVDGTVGSVPEPASVCGLVFAASAMLLPRRRRA